MTDASATISPPPSPSGSATKPRMLLIVNPMATTVSQRLRNLVIYALRGRYDVEAIETQSQNHATELTEQAAAHAPEDGFDLVVAFGGDGTINEAANGLANSNVPLSFLPGGCTNVVCRMVGIPNDVVDATEHLLGLADNFNPRYVDLGSVNGRYFLFSSGVGMDADVTRWVDERPRAKAKGGVATFTFAAVSTYLREYRASDPGLEVEYKGERYEGLSALVQNSDPYTYFNAVPLHVCEDISMDNGALSMMVMQRAKMRDVPGVMKRLFAKEGRLATHPQAVSLTKVEEARITPLNNADGVPIEVDGDYIGKHSEAVYRAHPGALRILA